MKKKAFALIALAAVALGVPAVLAAAEPCLVVEATIVPGPEWTGSMWIAVIKVKKEPQYAVWVETADGEYVATLAVSGKTVSKDWTGAPDEGRPESLPVWSAVRARASGSDPSVDAASSATPDASQAISGSVDLVPGREYVIRLEVNHSFDYNERWPKKAKKGSPGYSGVNGQPSLVYEGRFRAERGATVWLVPVAQGSVDGSDGLARAGLDGLSTALEIVSSAMAEVKEK